MEKTSLKFTSPVATGQNVTHIVRSLNGNPSQSEQQTNLVMGILGEQSQVLMDVAKLLDVPRSVMMLHIMIRWLLPFSVSLFQCFCVSV
jgi:hypothetical protein